jgi:signal peptidase I
MVRVARAGFYGLLFAIATLVLLTRLVPAVNGYQPVALTGQSMTGTMDMGSLLYVNPAAEPGVGSVITFTHGGRLWTHRIIEATHSLRSYDELRWQTKGDAMPQPDPFVIDPETIHGVVEWHTPYIGYAVLFLTTPAGWLFAGLLGLTLYYFSKERPMTTKEKVRDHDGNKDDEILMKDDDMPEKKDESVLMAEGSYDAVAETAEDDVETGAIPKRPEGWSEDQSEVVTHG